MLKEIKAIYRDRVLNEGLKIDAGKKDVKGDDTPDQNKDGQNNFKDVMIARMMKSGMSKEEAIEYVENNYSVTPKVKVDENFSNWRSDLREVLDDLQADMEASQIKKKNVNNYKNKAINLSPTLGQVAEDFGGELIGEFELTEDYVDMAIEIAANYFYEQGLNEDGIDLVIEEVGLDTFVDFAFDLAEDYVLSEERAARRRKGGKSYDEVKAEIDAKEKAKKENVGKKITTDKVTKSVGSAAETQPTKKQNHSSILDRVASAVNAGIQNHNSSIENLRNNPKVRNTRAGLAKAKRTIDRNILPDLGGALGRAAGTASVAHKKGETKASALVKGLRAGIGKLFGEDFELWVDELLDEGYDLTDYSVVELHEAYLEEKAVSEQQQKLFGLALAYKRGEASNVSKEVIKLANSMSEKELIKYASTKHEDVPKRV